MMLGTIVVDANIACIDSYSLQNKERVRKDKESRKKMRLNGVIQEQ